jgi:hypothetical protein
VSIDRDWRHLADWERILRVRRREFLSLVVVVFLAVVAGTASASTSWPSRSGPLNSTLGWFKAINEHDRKHLLHYVALSTQVDMGWAQPSRAWPKFTALHCRRVNVHTTNAHLRCTFNEHGSLAVVGNRDTFWDVYLRRTRGAWLIDNYGQG